MTTAFETAADGLALAITAGMKFASQLGGAMTAAYAYHATGIAMRSLEQGDEQGALAVLSLMRSEFARRAAIEEERAGRSHQRPEPAEFTTADRVGDGEKVAAL